MHFELLLTGKVPSGKGGRHSRDRLALRLQIDEQMRALWASEPLRNRDDLQVDKANVASGVVKRHGKTFVTPVRERLWTACQLDVVFYEPSGSLRIASDVADPDNRIAGLLDVLSIPTSPAEAEALPETSFVLLEDDKLVWGLSVERRRLLRSLEGGHTFCRIAVRVIPTRATLDNPALIDIPGH